MSVATQCTVVGDNREATFNPASPAGTTPVKVAKNLHDMIDLGLSDGHAVHRPRRRRRRDHVQPAGAADERFRQRCSSPTTRSTAITCPATTQCTTIAQNGTASTFNPTIRPRAHQDPARKGRDRRWAWAERRDRVGYLSVDELVRRGRRDRHAIGSPRLPHMSIKAVKIDRGTPLVGVSCPSTRQCTAMRPTTGSPSTRATRQGQARARYVTDRFFEAQRHRLRERHRVPGGRHRPPGDVQPPSFQDPKLRQLAAFTDAAILGLGVRRSASASPPTPTATGSPTNPRRG